MAERMTAKKRPATRTANNSTTVIPCLRHTQKLYRNRKVSPSPLCFPVQRGTLVRLRSPRRCTHYARYPRPSFPLIPRALQARSIKRPRETSPAQTKVQHSYHTAFTFQCALTISHSNVPSQFQINGPSLVAVPPQTQETSPVRRSVPPRKPHPTPREAMEATSKVKAMDNRQKSMSLVIRRM